MKLSKMAFLLAASTFALATAAPGSIGVTVAPRLDAAPADVFQPRPDLVIPVFSGEEGEGGDTGGGGDDDSASDDDSDDGAAETNRKRNRNRRAKTPPLAAPTTPAANPVTQSIVRQMEETDDNCGKINQPYRIDCIASEYRDLAGRLPRRGDYAEARAALDDVASQLERIARNNRDRRQSRIKVNVNRVGAPPAQSRALSAVRPDRLQGANQQAQQAIEQGRLTLLRSAPPGDPRRAHYQRIASAFDDAAVLLRS